MDEEQQKRPKYRHTRELLKLALDDGMTQEEIARICRTQQSTVSAWKNGKSKATVQQLEPLLKRYGARLRRTTSRVYLLGDPVDRYGTPTGEPPRMHVVEGPVVFRHVFTRLAFRPSHRGGDLVREPIARWIVHEHPGPSFTVVNQARRTMTSQEKRLEEEKIQESLYELQCDQRQLFAAVQNQLRSRRWVETAEDAARWTSTISPPRSLTELLRWVDEHTTVFPHEATTVRFLLRKALLEQGHAIPGVERTASPE